MAYSYVLYIENIRTLILSMTFKLYYDLHILTKIKKNFFTYTNLKINI